MGRVNILGGGNSGGGGGYAVPNSQPQVSVGFNMDDWADKAHARRMDRERLKIEQQQADAYTKMAGNQDPNVLTDNRLREEAELNQRSLRRVAESLGLPEDATRFEVLQRTLHYNRTNQAIDREIDERHRLRTMLRSAKGAQNFQKGLDRLSGQPSPPPASSPEKVPTRFEQTSSIVDLPPTPAEQGANLDPRTRMQSYDTVDLFNPKDTSASMTSIFSLNSPEAISKFVDAYISDPTIGTPYEGFGVAMLAPMLSVELGQADAAGSMQAQLNASATGMRMGFEELMKQGQFTWPNVAQMYSESVKNLLTFQEELSTTHQNYLAWSTQVPKVATGWLSHTLANMAEKGEVPTGAGLKQNLYSFVFQNQPEMKTFAQHRDAVKDEGATWATGPALLGRLQTLVPLHQALGELTRNATDPAQKQALKDAWVDMGEDIKVLQAQHVGDPYFDKMFDTVANVSFIDFMAQDAAQAGGGKPGDSPLTPDAARELVLPSFVGQPHEVEAAKQKGYQSGAAFNPEFESSLPKSLSESAWAQRYQDLLLGRNEYAPGGAWLVDPSAYGFTGTPDTHAFRSMIDVLHYSPPTPSMDSPDTWLSYRAQVAEKRKQEKAAKLNEMTQRVNSLDVRSQLPPGQASGGTQKKQQKSSGMDAKTAFGGQK